MATQRYEGESNENLPSPISVRAVFRASRRYWWLILALWIVGSAGIGAGVYLKVRPQYRALSLLKVNPTVIDLYGGASHEGGEPYMKTHVELIKSSSVLTTAALDPNVMALPRMKIASDAKQELSRVIQVRIVPDTHLIEVSMTSPVADEAAILVYAVVEAFIDANLNWSNGSTKSQIEKLSAYVTRLETDIKKTEEEIRIRVARGEVKPRIVAKNGDNANGDDAAKADWNVDNYTRMLHDFHQVKLDLLLAEANLSEARRVAEEYNREQSVVGNQQKSSSQVDQRLLFDSELSGLQSEYEKARRRVNEIHAKARGFDPAEEKARAVVATAQKNWQLARERKKQEFMSDQSTGSVSNDPNLVVKVAENEIKRLIIKRDTLEHTLSDLKMVNTAQQSDDLELRFFEEDRAELKGMQNTVTKKLEQLNFDVVGEERISRVDKSRPEGIQISDKRIQYMAIAPIGVLGAVLGLVVLLEIRSGRVADTEVLSSRMRHEVFSIAPLPNIRTGIGSDTDKAEQRLARFVQSLDHLRVALCEGGSNGEGRCVMITSATGGEGKTTLSAHLAARCANAGTSTLLIDADLRRASLGRLLDVPPGMGLGDVLAGNAELESDLISVQAGGFHFLSAGTPGIDPSRVLRSTRLAELIGQLRQMYDLIIIDTPPVLPVADALIMGRWADGAVMAARYDASRLPLVERANRQIMAAGIPVLGVVVNGVKGQDQAYGSYSYSYNYPGRQEPLKNPLDAS